MFFWNSLASSVIQRMLAIWSLVPLPFLNPACTPGSSLFNYCRSLAWRILSMTFQHVKRVQLFGSLNILWHCLSYWPFPVLWTLLSFPNLLTHWVQHFTASSFRIWNSSTGIPSPPLALFVVMLSKAHLTSHSRVSGSRLSDHTIMTKPFSQLKYTTVKKAVTLRVNMHLFFQCRSFSIYKLSSC